MKLREYLFKGFTGCHSHDCVIEKPTGMGTNGSCQCISDANRTRQTILNSKIKYAIDAELVIDKVEITKEQMKEALDKAYKDAGSNAYFANGFNAGVEFMKEHFKDYIKE